MHDVCVGPREEQGIAVRVGPVHEVRRCAGRIVYLDDLSFAPVRHRVTALHHNVIACYRSHHAHLLHYPASYCRAMCTTPRASVREGDGGGGAAGGGWGEGDGAVVRAGDL